MKAESVMLLAVSIMLVCSISFNVYLGFTFVSYKKKMKTGNIHANGGAGGAGGTNNSPGGPGGAAGWGVIMQIGNRDGKKSPQE